MGYLREILPHDLLYAVCEFSTMQYHGQIGYMEISWFQQSDRCENDEFENHIDGLISKLTVSQCANPDEPEDDPEHQAIMDRSTKEVLAGISVDECIDLWNTYSSSTTSPAGVVPKCRIVSVHADYFEAINAMTDARAGARVGTKSGESAGTSCTSTPSDEPTPSPRYYEVTIQPCSAGFGEWAPSEANGEGWDDIDNLEAEIRASVDVLEWAELENTELDIRGRIHRQNELMQIFVWRDNDGCLHYGGIVEANE